MQLEKVGKKGPPLHGVHQQQVQQTAARKKNNFKSKGPKNANIKDKELFILLDFWEIECAVFTRF